MAGFKLMAKMTPEEYKAYVIDGTLYSNMNKGVTGTPIWAKNLTVQSATKPVTNSGNPLYHNPNQQSTFIANNTLAQSNYMNPRRMKNGV